MINPIPMQLKIINDKGIVLITFFIPATSSFTKGVFLITIVGA
jgi:hypothetical protein